MLSAIIVMQLQIIEMGKWSFHVVTKVFPSVNFIFICQELPINALRSLITISHLLRLIELGHKILHMIAHSVQTRGLWDWSIRILYLLFLDLKLNCK